MNATKYQDKVSRSKAENAYERVQYYPDSHQRILDRGIDFTINTHYLNYLRKQFWHCIVYRKYITLPIRVWWSDWKFFFDWECIYNVILYKLFESDRTTKRITYFSMFGFVFSAFLFFALTQRNRHSNGGGHSLIRQSLFDLEATGICENMTYKLETRMVWNRISLVA